jgi:predicted ester cyclase
METKRVITAFIEKIWNKREFENINDFVSEHYKDFSLPPILKGDSDGTIAWIKSTSKAFEHRTTIDEIVAEENKVMVKVKMQMKHIGVWRDILPTGAEISVTGYRFFKLYKDKIVEHWGMIDGNAIENKLKEVKKVCVSL